MRFFTQGVTLGWELLPFQGVWGKPLQGVWGRTFLERVRESDRHELLKLPIALIILTLRSIIETRIEEDIR